MIYLNETDFCNEKLIKFNRLKTDHKQTLKILRLHKGVIDSYVFSVEICFKQK